MTQPKPRAAFVGSCNAILWDIAPGHTGYHGYSGPRKCSQAGSYKAGTDVPTNVGIPDWTPSQVIIVGYVAGMLAVLGRIAVPERPDRTPTDPS
eukprot:177557-Chlamydomonas_euryale.AAC.14